MQQTRAAPATLEAVLERITYANEDTGYTVARVATDRSADLLTVVDPLLGHKRSWSATENRRSQVVHRYGLGRRTSLTLDSNPT